MGTSMDATGIPSSLTQRRQAASNLPAFELPPPNLQFAAPQFSHKFPPLAGLSNPHSSLHHQGNVSVGNLLTPPPNSSESSGANSANLPPGQGMPVLPYTPTFWQGAGTNPQAFNAGLTPQPWQNGQLFNHRTIFSPMSGQMTRNDPQSPSSSGASTLPPPSYDVAGVHQYAQSVSLASPSSTTAHASQHPGLSNPLMHHLRPPIQNSPISPGEAASKASSTPALFSAMNPVTSPQPPYGFQSSTPVSQSPHSVNVPAATTSPPLQNGPIPHMQAQPSHFIKQPYPAYTLPAMPGPVFTNINSPGSQMSVVGPHNPVLPMHYNSGYAANPQLAYNQARANSPQQAANQDRPFKCDECPQSFNRNHDLKRHKRIHLAVKPFPCSHCDKSFSRKDALKRHILVKGCGKAGESENQSGDGVKSDAGSDAQDASKNLTS